MFMLVVWGAGIALNAYAGNPLVNVLTVVWTVMSIGLGFQCVEISNANHIKHRGNKTTLYYWDDDDPPRRFR